RTMGKRYLSFGVLLLTLGCATRTIAQQDQTQFHVIVDLVQLNVAVTDSKGNYVTGLKPSDFQVTEDGIAQTISTFAEANSPALGVADVETEGQPPAPDPSKATAGDPPPGTLSALVAGSNVYILFDTSNYMYRDFVFAQDGIADFVRSLETADKIAFYS